MENQEINAKSNDSGLTYLAPLLISELKGASHEEILKFIELEERWKHFLGFKDFRERSLILMAIVKTGEEQWFEDNYINNRSLVLKLNPNSILDGIKETEFAKEIISRLYLYVAAKKREPKS